MTGIADDKIENRVFYDLQSFPGTFMLRTSSLRPACRGLARLSAPFASFLLALACSAPLQAQTEPAAAFDDETRATLVEQAAALREQASNRKSEAEARFSQDDAACYKKFLSNDCRDAVKKARSQSIAEARKLESEARAIDRRVRLRDAIVHENERREALPKRAQEQAEQAMKFREAQDQAAATRAKRQADKQHVPGAPGGHVTTKPAPAGDAAAAQAHSKDLEETQKRMAERDKRAAEKAAERAKKEAARVAGD